MCIINNINQLYFFFFFGPLDRILLYAHELLVSIQPFEFSGECKAINAYLHTRTLKLIIMLISSLQLSSSSSSLLVAYLVVMVWETHHHIQRNNTLLLFQNDFYVIVIRWNCVRECSEYCIYCADVKSFCLFCFRFLREKNWLAAWLAAYLYSVCWSNKRNM